MTIIPLKRRLKSDLSGKTFGALTVLRKGSEEALAVLATKDI